MKNKKSLIFVSFYEHVSHIEYIQVYHYEGKINDHCILASVLCFTGCTSAKQQKYYNQQLKLQTTLTVLDSGYVCLNSRAADYNIQLDILYSDLVQNDDGSCYIGMARFVSLESDGKDLNFAVYFNDDPKMQTVDSSTFVVNYMQDSNGMDQLAKYAREVLNDTSENSEGLMKTYPRAYHAAEAMLEEAEGYLPELLEMQEKYTDKGLQKEA